MMKSRRERGFFMGGEGKGVALALGEAKAVVQQARFTWVGDALRQ